MMKRLFLLLFLTCQLLTAHDSDSLISNVQSFGFQIGGKYNIHNIDNSFLENYQMEDYESQYHEYGIFLGINYEYPIYDNLRLGLLSSISTLNKAYLRPETGLMVSPDDTSEKEFDRNLLITMSRFSVTPYLKYYPIGNLNIGCGFDMGWLFENKLELNNTYEEDDFYRFEGFGTKRTLIEEEIAYTNTTLMNMFFTLSYDFFIDRNNLLSMSPMLRYTLPLNNLSDDFNWSISSIDFGLNFKYYIKTTKSYSTEFKTIKVIDTVEIQRDDLIFDRFIKGKEDYKSFVDTLDYTIFHSRMLERTDTSFIAVETITPDFVIITDEIKAKRNLIKESFPIINSVFFNESNSVSPSNIINVQQFDETQLPPDPVFINKNNLSIIKNRLKTGTMPIILKAYSNPVTERENCSLSKQRAERVSKLLSIGQSNIQLDTANNSCIPPNPVVLEKYSNENSRVEIVTLFKQLFRPIEIQYSEMLTNDFTVEIKNIVSKKNYKLDLKYENGQLFGLTSDLPFEYKFWTGFNPDNNPFINLEISFNNKTVKKEIPFVFENLNSIQRHSIVIFEKNSADLPTDAKLQIRQLLEILPDNATISITGYTDDLGEYDYNMKLSEDRANNTAEFIKEIKTDLKLEKVIGLGSSQFHPKIKSYDTPLERYLSRLVLIDIVH